MNPNFSEARLLRELLTVKLPANLEILQSELRKARLYNQVQLLFELSVKIVPRHVHRKWEE